MFLCVKIKNLRRCSWVMIGIKIAHQVFYITYFTSVLIRNDRCHRTFAIPDLRYGAGLLRGPPNLPQIPARSVTSRAAQFPALAIHPPGRQADQRRTAEL